MKFKCYEKMRDNEIRKMKTICDLNTQEYLVLFRHWKWADIVREQYEKSDVKYGKSLLFERKAGFRFIWYGLLYVVIEFMAKKEVTLSKITEEIDHVKDSLRLCRNATFHIQSELFTEKYSPEIVIRAVEHHISKIHAEIGKNVQMDLRRRIEEIPNNVKRMHNITEMTSEREMIHHLYFLQGYYF